MSFTENSKRPFVSGRTLRALWVLGLPTILEEAMHTAVSYIDTAMVGQIGAEASASVGLTSNVFWLLFGPLFAVSVALLAVISQAHGAGDLESVRKAPAQAMWAVIVLGTVETVFALSISPYLPAWMNGDPELYADASAYFAIVSSPMIFRSSSIIFGYVLRANHDSKTPMIINVTMNVINIVLNQLFIGNGTTFHLFGLDLYVPGMGWGVRGAALATTLSVVWCGCAMFYAVMKNPQTTLKGISLRPDLPMIRRSAKIAAPLAVERLVVSVGQVIFAAQVAGLGSIATASHSISLTVEQAFYIPGYGMQAATSTLVGNAVGKRDEEELRQVRRASLLTSVSLMSAMAVALFLFPHVLLSIFTPDQRIVELGSVLLRIVAVSEPLFAVLIVTEGVFMGLGETKAPVIIATLSVWIVRTGGTVLTIGLLGGGVEWAWICMVADNITRCALLNLWYFRGSWRKRAGFISQTTT